MSVFLVPGKQASPGPWKRSLEAESGEEVLKEAGVRTPGPFPGPECYPGEANPHLSRSQAAVVPSYLLARKGWGWGNGMPLASSLGIASLQGKKSHPMLLLALTCITNPTESDPLVLSHFTDTKHPGL